jgi:mevalonate kinase
MRELLADACAPGKVILFGEHAVNRGQAGIAASVNLYARCQLWYQSEGFVFEGAGKSQSVTHDDILAIRQDVDLWRETANLDAIRQLAERDFFAPQKFILAHAFGSNLPNGMWVSFESEIAPSSGLGSGGAAFCALAKALAKVRGETDKRKIGEWAWLGDVIAHGGVASALDTQTSLHGGVIRYTRESWGERIQFDPSLALVIAHSGMSARTSEINTRVRQWLAEDATRMRFFDMIGVLSHDALMALAEGDWLLLGKLMNMNQLVLEKIGVSCEELEAQIRAALAAGAYGAKLSGSGGGGIMVALVSSNTKQRVVNALHESGASAVYTPEIAMGD